jgi:hypothetical protein
LRAASVTLTRPGSMVLTVFKACISATVFESGPNVFDSCEARDPSGFEVRKRRDTAPQLQHHAH